MNLLQKFAGVTVTADARITEADRHFCQAHQAAYDNAKSCLQELAFFWEDILSQQTELMHGITESSCLYLTSGDNLNLSKTDIQKQLFAIHGLFVGHLVSFFNKTYHLSLSIMDMEEKLIPQKPTDKWMDDYEDQVRDYTKAMQDLSLRYTDILDQIFLYTDGRELSEQALHELKEKCHEAAWKLSDGKARFTQKKCILTLNGCFCSFYDRYSGGCWEPAQSTSDILKGIAHFETGDFSSIPYSINKLIEANNLTYDFYEFGGCKKALSLKMYKNHRVDIKFSTERYARQFISEYLGDICLGGDQD